MLHKAQPAQHVVIIGDLCEDGSCSFFEESQRGILTVAPSCAIQASFQQSALQLRPKLEVLLAKIRLAPEDPAHGIMCAEGCEELWPGVELHICSLLIEHRFCSGAAKGAAFVAASALSTRKGATRKGVSNEKRYPDDFFGSLRGRPRGRRVVFNPGRVAVRALQPTFPIYRTSSHHHTLASQLFKREPPISSYSYPASQPPDLPSEKGEAKKVSE